MCYIYFDLILFIKFIYIYYLFFGWLMRPSVFETTIKCFSSFSVIFLQDKCQELFEQCPYISRGTSVDTYYCEPLPLMKLSFGGRYLKVTLRLGGLLLVLESVNSSVNIFIYYRMSSIYREVFRLFSMKRIN